jgi:arylsulfatase A-like enzyme
MRLGKGPLLLACLGVVGSAPALALGARNIVIFVADGLRAGSVNATDAPSMSALRAQGVSFINSHALFPTFTTPNASAIATGHYLGDTGDFSNSLYVGYRTFDTGNFSHPAAGVTPFIENDAVLGDLDDHFEGNFLAEESLLALARAHGYGTAAIGKLGPVAIQDVSQLRPKAGRFAVPQTILIDDATGADAPPLAPEVVLALERAGLPLAPPPRQQPSGDSRTPGTRTANATQQQYFIEATTRAVLPLLRRRGRPFVLLYWSRDPDGSQHNEGDSLNALEPGINGLTSRAGVHNADDNLRRILEFIGADKRLAATTDVFVTSDHGFATISKHDIDASGHASASSAAQAAYADVPPGFLPPGFLALDLARLLNEPLYDTDRLGVDAQHNAVYQPVKDHPLVGNALIGGSGAASMPPDADVIVAANGGSDLLYLPHGDGAQARRIAELLGTLDYIGAIFADDRYGEIPGALPLSSIALEGGARLPRPSLVVAFRTFTLNAGVDNADNSDNANSAGGATDGEASALLRAVQIADTPLQQGQGMHGSFGRDNTYNFMAAMGPDFKRHYVDELPVGNADIAPTLMQLLGLQPSARGELTGRVLVEALQVQRAVRRPHAPADAERCVLVSAAAADGRRTLLEYQRYEGRLYLDRAAYRTAAAGETTACRRGVLN